MKPSITCAEPQDGIRGRQPHAAGCRVASGLVRVFFGLRWMVCAGFFLPCFICRVSAQTPDSTLRLLKKVADWQLGQWERQGMKYGKDNWVYAAAYTGFMALGEYANDDRYLSAMLGIGEELGWNTGPSRTMADDYCVAQMYTAIYLIYHEPKMIARFVDVADSIISMPHNESLAWKNNIQLREWAWCDALFMGPPALAYLSLATGNPKYLDMADKLWWKTTDYLYDKQEHLYFRDSSFFSKREANGQKVFWSRGNGWVMAGLVRVLSTMPKDFPSYNRYVSLFRDMAARIKNLQHPDGSWHTSLLDSVAYRSKEVSGTCFYCYALGWGINHGLLSNTEYYPTVAKAWQTLEQCVHENGKLGYVQQIGDRPAATDSNSSESYGVGGFLLAGTQMIELWMGNKEKLPVLELYNPSQYPRKQKVIEIGYPMLAKKIGNTGNDRIKIVDALTGNEIAYQWEYRGNQKPVNLLLQIDLGIGTKMYLQISHENPSSFVAKTYCRFVPERKDDFAWENDKIAHRMYGKAIEGSSEDAYGVDVWVKRTNRLIINERYKRGEYHIDHGDGMDYYHVGHTLGAGNVMPYVDDSIWYSKNFHAYKILDNGPLRSTFQLTYDAWNVNGRSVQAVKTISTDAGSQLDRFQADYTYADTATMPLAVGIVKRSEPGNVLFDEKNNLMAYWEPRMGTDGTTGVACIVKAPYHKMMMNNNHLLCIANTVARSITYYAGACWDKAGEITDARQWFAYVMTFYNQLETPLKISVR